MDVSSILTSSADSASAVQKESKTTSSFESYFLKASGTGTETITTDTTITKTTTTNSDAASSYVTPADSADARTSKDASAASLLSADIASPATTTTKTTTTTSVTSSNNALQEFMKYAKETPEQRMFDSWLKSQNISEQQFKAMTPEQKQKLVDQFETQSKAKLKSEMTATASS
jgi:hypothetical protein